jgi:tRNA nucleotidyltransferase (CCA-adding enzyme)
MVVRFDPAVEAILRDVGRAVASLHIEAWAVGGVVRDALMGCVSRDVDVSIVGVVRTLAERLRVEWDASLESHDAFETATLLRGDGFTVDLARARSVYYERPGALPTVTPSCLTDDLKRRDFSVSALAASIADSGFGVLVDLHGGQSDIETRTLRVLHPASFQDDPTRLFRAARYAVRLGLEPDAETDRAGAAAVAGGALGTITADRRRHELELLLTEPHWADGVAWLNRWGVWAAITDGWEPGPGTLKRVDVARAWALRTVNEDVPSAAVVHWLTLLASAPSSLAENLVAKPAESRLVDAVRGVLDSLQGTETPLWWRELDAHPLSVLLSSLALCGSDSEKRRLTAYLERIRPVALAITGDDLLRNGVKPGPELGAALKQTLDAVRCGQLPCGDAAAELNYATGMWRALTGETGTPDAV